MSDLWVCSKFIEGREPKDEEKFRVLTDTQHYYDVEINETRVCLLKLHYIPCPAPEQWEPVEVRLKKTSAMDWDIELAENGKPIGDVAFNIDADGYRVKSLVVERRKG